jgi:hypothetical protein
LILLCSISCSVLNGIVACTDGDNDDDSFIEFDNMQSFTCEIRFEVPKRQREEEKKVKEGKYRYFNSAKR